MENEICYITGNRPNGFPWNYKNKDGDRYLEYIESLYFMIDSLIRGYGVNHFVCGGEPGVETDCAEILIYLRDNVYDGIKLEIVAACANQDRKWKDGDKIKYRQIVEQANKVLNLYDTYTPNAFLLRNKYIVDKSDIVLTFLNRHRKFCDTYKTAEYARSKGKTLKIVHLNDY